MLAPQLSLFHRQILVVRASVFSLLEDERAHTLVQSAGDLVKFLELQLDRQEFFKNSAQLTLDGYTRWALEKLDRLAHAEGFPRSDYERDLLHKLKGASQVSCETCSTRGGAQRHRCDGSVLDAATVRDQGMCVSHVLTTFDWIVEQARQTYAAHCPLATHARPVLSMLPSAAERPHGFPELELNVSGSIRYDDALQSQITITLYPFGVRPQCLHAVPYVIAHEVFAHAFHGILCSDGQRRQPPDPRDLFYEGWMDWIAREWVIRSLHSAERRHKSREIACARRYSETRANEGAARHDGDCRSQMCAGHTAAERACGLLFDREDPLGALMALSVHLNAQHARSEELAQLALTALATEQDEHLAELLSRAFAAFLNSWDHEELFESVRSIHREYLQ